MKIKVLQNVVASGRPLRANTIVDVSKTDAAVLIGMQKAVPADGQSAVTVENREKDISFLPRETHKFVCPHCQKSYIRKDHYQNHIKNAHKEAD